MVVDDLKPGYDMAHAAGVPFAAACWAYDVPEIRQFMEANCALSFTDPATLEKNNRMQKAVIDIKKRFGKK